MSRFHADELNTLFWRQLWFYDVFATRKSAEKYGKSRKIGTPKTGLETDWAPLPTGERSGRLFTCQFGDAEVCRIQAKCK
jgi:hypothetical protein